MDTATPTADWQPRLATSRPGYQDLVQAIEADIRAGHLAPGAKMPTHRELSTALGISRGTVARAYDEARRAGLLHIGIGQGSFVSHDHRVLSKAPPAGEIDFGMAYPLYELDPDPGEVFAALAQDGARHELLRYPPPGGSPEHRAAGALWCAELGVGVEADDVVVTAGAQHAVHVWMLSALRPGDTLLAGELTYRMTAAAAEALGLAVRGVALDAEGIVPGELDRAARETGARGLYVMPTVQNPTTGIQSESRRRELLEVVRARGLEVLEDDTYAPFLESRPPALKELCPDRVTYVASLSKSVAGGLRVAYAAPPGALHAAFSSALNVSIWAASSISSEIASRWIRDGTASSVMAAKRREARARIETLEERLRSLVAALGTGAYLAWLRLAPPATAAGLALEARRHGVVVMPAEAFFVGEGQPPEAVRISLGCANREEVSRGLRILEQLLARPAPPFGPIM